MSITEETNIDPKYLSNKGYIKPFQKVYLYMGNVLIYYYDTPRTARVSQIRLKVVPVKFILVVMSAFQVFLLA